MAPWPPNPLRPTSRKPCRPPPAPGAAKLAEFEKWLAAQPREPLVVPAEGAAVVVVKFNDYQCPPCRQTYMEYKPIFAKWAKQAPGKVKFVTKDFALERECNAAVSSDVHPAAARRPWPCAWLARRARPKRWRNGSSPTSPR